jgi:glycerophosphoryl diester phosphodiesterase
MRTALRIPVLSFSVLAVLVLGVRPAEPSRRGLEGTVRQLLESDVRPFAIGHRGSGENLGEDPSRPIENTVAAVRAGFRAGLPVVEVDVQLTRDGQLAAFHEDFLPDFTCLNTLTLRELQARLPHVPSLKAVLNKARTFNEDPEPGDGLPRGLLIVELKAPSPLCDPQDTQEQALVSAVVQVIQRSGMRKQVMLTSFSPALLALAKAEDPGIVRILAISGLQFLSAEQIEAELGLPVTLIDKSPDFGLQWAEIGPIFRLPGYGDIDQVFTTALVATGVRVIEADLFFLASGGAQFVEAAQSFGLKIFGFTANNDQEYLFLQGLGVDGIYRNDVELCRHRPDVHGQHGRGSAHTRWDFRRGAARPCR